MRVENQTLSLRPDRYQTHFVAYQNQAGRQSLRP